MSAPGAARRSTPFTAPMARVRAAIGYDGPVSTVALQVFQHFMVSVSFIGCLVPALLFQVLVGWQGTHLALWLGAASLLPVVPAVFAALIAARAVLVAGATSGGGRAFWRSFADASRSLWWLALTASAAVLVLGYDLALMGSSDAVFLLSIVASVLFAVLVVATCQIADAHTDADSNEGPLTLVVCAATTIARRPHIALSWVLLVVLAGLACTVPVIGPATALFAPGLVASGIVICSTALGFTPSKETRS